MTGDAHLPESILRRLRTACAHLPEAYEEQLFDFTRWRIRTRTLLHVAMADLGDGPLPVMTFHAAGEEHDALIAMGDPFSPGWGPGLVAMVLRDDGTTDWTEVEELITESYCLLAPKKLIALLAGSRPDPDRDA